MTPGLISRRIVVDRFTLLEELLRDIRALPLTSEEEFLTDRRNLWTAESCLRRSLEAVFDIGRHILSKGFAQGVSEYKEIAEELKKKRVLSVEDSGLLRRMAGYRNRLVHLYHEVSPSELYAICAERLGDIDQVAQGVRAWLLAHPDKLDQGLE